MFSQRSHDAVLIVSFGGPEGMDEVMPFLENIFRGKNVPAGRLLEVRKHYEMFGGVSPINEQNRRLIAALRRELDANGPHIPIYWGNRNWHPLLTETILEMRDAGIKHALAFVTSPYSSYSSCRQYLENIAQARERAGPNAPSIEKIRAFYNHPLFIQANVENARAALGKRSDSHGKLQLIFTAHSIPDSMAQNCVYEQQLRETSRLIAAALDQEDWQLVYQSRSGPTGQGWLGPDIGDYLNVVSEKGICEVVIVPIGFVAEHMEVIYDLDTHVRRICEELGLKMSRASTVGTHPLFIQMIRELIMERTASLPPRSIGAFGPSQDLCAAGCCISTTVSK